jgi:hypothetical protein
MKDTELRIPAIENFLSNWKLKALEFYLPILEKEKELVENLRQAENFLTRFDRLEYEKAKLAHEKVMWTIEDKELTDETRAKYTASRRELEKVEKKREPLVNETGNRRKTLNEFYKENAENIIWNGRTLWVGIDREVTARRNELVSRVENKAGAIKDASGLYIGSNGSINGFIIGEKQTVEVETIFAGGYNIQRLHYRVLVK